VTQQLSEGYIMTSEIKPFFRQLIAGSPLVFVLQNLAVFSGFFQDFLLKSWLIFDYYYFIHTLEHGFSNMSSKI